MSSAGHVLDMINRFNNNRQLQKERHSQYAKVKKAYQKQVIKHIVFTSKQNLSAEEIEIIRLKIRSNIKKEFKKRIILTITFTPMVLLVIYIISRKIITNWPF